MKPRSDSANRNSNYCCRDFSFGRHETRKEIPGEADAVRGCRRKNLENLNKPTDNPDNISRFGAEYRFRSSNARRIHE